MDENRMSDYYKTHDELGRPTTLAEYQKTDCHEYCDLAQRCFVKGQRGNNPEACVQHAFIESLMY